MLAGSSAAYAIESPDPEPLVRRLGLYVAHSGQQPVHDSAARNRIVNTGRRVGKTTLGVNEVAKYAWEHADSLSWWIGPTYQHVEVAYEMLCQHFRDAMARTPVTSPYPRIWWKSGARTHMHTAEKPDNLRGRGIGFVVLDEAAMIRRRLWEEVVKPTLADTVGRALFLSTPRGRGNWYYDLFMRGQDRAVNPEYESWSMPSSARPRMPGDRTCDICGAAGGNEPAFVDCEHPAMASEIEEARRTLPRDTFRQEWLAEFLEGSAGVFRNILGCVGGELHGPLPGHSYVLGWDPGRWQDPSVMVVLDVSVTPAQVVYFDRFLGPDWTVQAARCETLARHYKARVWIDATHGSVGDPLFSFISKGDLTVKRFDFTAHSKQALIEHLILRVERGEVMYPDIPMLLSEMEAFERTVTEAGTVRYSAPEGLHDDCVIALALAVWGGLSGGGGLMEVMRQDYEDKQRLEKEALLLRPAGMAAAMALNTPRTL